MSEKEYTSDQLYELEQGRLRGISIAPYFDPGFLAVQMRQIRFGLEEGLDVSVYASLDYDWFQMEEIRLGLKDNLPVEKYADPSLYFMNMRQIRLGLADGIDLSGAKKRPYGILKELRMAHEAHVDISSFVKEGYQEEQLEQIRYALLSKVDILPFINKEFRGAMIKEIRLGLESQLDVKRYATTVYDWMQMREIRLGLQRRLPVELYLNPLFRAEQMQEIRLGLEEGLDVSGYASLMFTPKEMRKRRKRALAPLTEKSTGVKRELSFETFSLYIIEEELQAFLVPATSASVPTIDEMKLGLANAGIVYGIKQDALEEIASGIKPGQNKVPILVAEGKKPQRGRDGYYTFSFQAAPTIPPVLSEDGSIDYKNGRWYESVKKGEQFATYHSSIMGEDGYTLLGTPLAGIRGRELQALTGTGFTLCEDQKTYVSNMDGKIEVREDTDGTILVTITPLLELEEANPISGDVEFDGNIHVLGNVLTGALLSASGDIVIDGGAGDCILKAGGNIVIRNGCNAGGGGSITANSVYASFFENTRVVAKDTICAAAVLSTELHADARIHVSGPIVGGRTSANRLIQAKQVGNAMGLPTVLALQGQKILSERLTQKKTQLEECNREYELLQHTNELSRKKGLSFDTSINALLFKLENSLIVKKEEISALEEEIQEILSKQNEIADCRIIISEELYDGVTVIIGDHAWEPAEMKHVIIEGRNDKIKLRSI